MGPAMRSDYTLPAAIRPEEVGLLRAYIGTAHDPVTDDQGHRHAICVARRTTGQPKGPHGRKAIGWGRWHSACRNTHRWHGGSAVQPSTYHRYTDQTGANRDATRCHRCPAAV